MGQLFTPGLQITSSTAVRKRRELPLRGRILVSIGERVASDTIVAEADREGDLQLARVAESLGVAPEDVSSVMKVHEGEEVSEGQLIAEARSLWGLLRSSVHAPMSGTIEFISRSTGHVGIRGKKKTISLTGYIDGVVESVDEGRSVVIGTQATFVQGIFGVGGERNGVIRLLLIDSGTPVLPAHIPTDARGSILVGGHSPLIEALRAAMAAGAVGFVTGSIDDRILSSFVGHEIGVAITGDEEVPMTLIVTEGFGAIPMNPQILSVLGRVAGTSASINGATQVCAGALRPEIICRAADEGGSHGEGLGAGGLAPGSRVRLIRVPYFGMQGTVQELPHELARLETGAVARIARVKLDDDGRVVDVPRANLEASSR